MINLVRYSWEGIAINASHGEMIDVKDINYDVSHEKEVLYGKGASPVGYGKKNRAATGKMTIRREEFLRWQRHEGKSVLDLAPFPITVSYAADDAPTNTDVLRSCIITATNGMGAAQGDGEVTVDLDFAILGGVEYDGIIAGG